MARPTVILHRPLALLALLLLLLAAALAGPVVAPASAAACEDTFELPIEEETGEDTAVSPDDEVIEIQLGAHRSKAVAYAACSSSESKPKKANPNPGFGVVPGTGSTSRRVFDERRDQADRDADSLSSARKKRAKRTKTRR
ncbi:MAG: hypothetical protein JHC95_15760 [Solirubrobacteraceae bacterium]|nr:hypothetical protein [Solirubrobacteraceae bacterium]